MGRPGNVIRLRDDCLQIAGAEIPLQFLLCGLWCHLAGSAYLQMQCSFIAVQEGRVLQHVEVVLRVDSYSPVVLEKIWTSSNSSCSST